MCTRMTRPNRCLNVVVPSMSDIQRRAHPLLCGALGMSCFRKRVFELISLPRKDRMLEVSAGPDAGL